MVKQAVRQTYTYYTPEEPTGWVVRNAPLAGRGKAWTLGEYKHPAYPSPSNVRVGDNGIRVATVIGWLRSCGGAVEATAQKYSSAVEREDVEAARWFFEQFREHFEWEREQEA